MTLILHHTCVVCSADTTHDRGRCTNGCCGKCCDACCSYGGLTTNGHNLLPNLVAARRASLNLTLVK